MNPRDAISFVKSPTGAFLTFCFFLIVAFFVFRGFHPTQAKSKPLSLQAKAVAAEIQPQTVETVENKGFSPLNPPKPTNEEKPKMANEKTTAPKERRIELLPISLYADTAEPVIKPLSANYAPYGRLIPCELIITVDSSSIRTPIVGLVLEDVYHAGRLIIPAGTEVHGTAQIDRTRERIASGNRWTLVWQTGEELNLSGIALDREKEDDGWAITDGSTGLRGRIIKTDDLAEIKLFAATFLSGAASALTDKQLTIFGSQTAPTLRNAPLEGAQDVLAAYAKQIYQFIQRDGFYVRVPAGKQFYLYVMQTIDESDATVGGTRFSEPEVQPETQAAPVQPRSASVETPLIKPPFAP
jgi:Bacterial conjugation TrbI-like protein